MKNDKECSTACENKKMFIFGLGGFLLVALIAILGVGLFRVYSKTADDGFTVGVASVLRLPALKVADKTVLYVDYLEDLKAIKHVRDYDIKNNGPMATITEEQMSDQVLWRLATNVLVDKLAKDKGVVVSEDEIKEVRANVLEQFEGDEAKLEEELEVRYGWNLAEYEEKVIKPFLLQRNLAEKIATDEDANKKVKDEALEVLQKIKDGADFSEMAKEFGQDGTAENGGDLGWFGRGMMVVPFEMVAFDLEEGQVADELAETQFGFHIIKVEEKRTVKEENEDGSETDAEEIKAKHILFRYPSLDNYLDKMTDGSYVKVYLKVHNPFEVEEDAQL